MKKNTQFIKLFIVLFFSTVFIFSTSHFGVKAYEKIAKLDGKYSDGTKIGNIDLSGKTDTEAATLLEQRYMDWLKNTKFTFQYSEKSVPFDLNLFYLDKETTINSIKDGQANPVFISIDLTQLEDQVSILFPELNSKEIDFTKLKARLESNGSMLQNGEHSFDLTTDFMLANAEKKETVINEAVLKLTDIPVELPTFINQDSEIKIAEGATFSLLNYAKNLQMNNSNLLSILGTGIYQTVLPTNFKINDRNISNTLPDYAGLGLEARVNPDQNMDLIFTNPNKTSYTIVFGLNDNALTISLKGEPFVYSYTISKQDEQSIKPKTIVQYSPQLTAGSTMVQAAGADGLYVKVYRDVYQGEQLVRSEFISEDYYSPTYRVETHGLTGTTQGTAATTSQTTINTTPSTETSPDGSQTTLTSDTSQQDSNVDDLWGKPNEQPK